MAYPEIVDRFPTKLDKKPDGSAYAIEEKLAIAGGKFEGYLSHDNIANNTVKVFTGSHFTGTELTNWTLSSPTEAPWRRYFKISTAPGPYVFVTYETPGDSVDADDVNVLQQAITSTQTEIERYKSSGIIDGGAFNEGE